MALTYNVSVAPTLDKDKTKDAVENLKALFTDGKIDIDLSPVVETASKMAEAFANVTKEIENFGSKFNDNIDKTKQLFKNMSEGVDNTSKAVEEATKNIEQSTKLTGVQKDNFDKMTATLASVNLKIGDYKDKIAAAQANACFLPTFLVGFFLLWVFYCVVLFAKIFFKLVAFKRNTKHMHIKCVVRIIIRQVPAILFLKCRSFYVNLEIYKFAIM